MKRSMWTKTIIVVVAVMGVATMAFAQGRGRGNGGGGGKPGGETAPNSLSVPAVLIGGSPSLAFPIGDSVAPTGTPISGYPINPLNYYYVQGVHQWQASSVSASITPVDVFAAWGDNLTGEARLKTNSPIRVEMGLLASNATDYAMTGWDVAKLEPDKLDREAAYGTLASGSPETGFVSNPITPYPEVRVYDSSATLHIFNKDTGEEIVNNSASAEVNSTGRIVYGYNLRVATVGTYVIEFTAPNVNILEADGGTFTSDTATLEIVVTLGGGKGGGPKNR